MRKLREQGDAIEKLDEAISKAGTLSLKKIRNRLTKLGMFNDFNEAGKARYEDEELQKEWTRKLLDESIKEAKKARDEVLWALAEDGGDEEVRDVVGFESG